MELSAAWMSWSYGGRANDQAMYLARGLSFPAFAIRLFMRRLKWLKHTRWVLITFRVGLTTTGTGRKKMNLGMEHALAAYFQAGINRL